LSYFEQNILFLVKLNPEVLEEAKATLASSLFLLTAKKKAIIESFRQDS